MIEHNVVLERGQEYDEMGNVCGEWAHEVCSKCGERTDMMNSDPECPVQDYVTSPDSVFYGVLESKKKTCTKEILLKTLSAIADLGITFEGEGGRTAYYGDDYEVGTGLRAPDMPFYYKPRATRQAVLKHLEGKKLIIVKEHDQDGWEGIEITEFGKEVLNAFHMCDSCGSKLEWYHSTGYYQTGERSGFRRDARVLLCQCKKEEFIRMCAMSKNTNSKRALGNKIVQS